MATKIILTVRSNLKSKYGPLFTEVEKLLNQLIKSDKEKELDTSLIYIDDQAAAAKYHFTKVEQVVPKTCKEVVDEIYIKHAPDYLVIFGAQDLFPFQELINPAYEEGADDDKVIPTDLPYACSSPFGNDCNSFTNPSRVVGRIPDLPETADLAYVKVLIDNIIHAAPVARSKYSDYLAVSASVWEKSTQESIQHIFGNYKDLLLSPPVIGGTYKPAQLKPLSHFFNCHGALNDTNYYGQKGSSYPVALRSQDLDKDISYGTVAAAECCYGAQLLNPAQFGMSIANNYLFRNALSFMGSSNIAYGPAEGQGLADLICQYYIINIHNGASCGRALLEARQKFLSVSGPALDPYELKTAAQFYILGDPSLQLVEKVSSKSMVDTLSNRRLNLMSKGVNLGATIFNTIKVRDERKGTRNDQLLDILKRSGLDGVEKEMTFQVEKPFAAPIFSKQLRFAAAALSDQEITFRVYQKEAQEHPVVRTIKTLVVKEVNNEILGYKIYVSR